jgi:hypothetical protein
VTSGLGAAAGLRWSPFPLPILPNPHSQFFTFFPFNRLSVCYFCCYSFCLILLLLRALPCNCCPATKSKVVAHLRKKEKLWPICARGRLRLSLFSARATNSNSKHIFASPFFLPFPPFSSQFLSSPNFLPILLPQILPFPSIAFLPFSSQFFFPIIIIPFPLQFIIGDLPAFCLQLFKGHF